MIRNVFSKFTDLSELDPFMSCTQKDIELGKKIESSLAIDLDEADFSGLKSILFYKAVEFVSIEKQKAINLNNIHFRRI